MLVERCRYTRFKLRYRLGVLTSAKLVCTSGDEECLLGTEATFFDCHANFFPQIGGRVSKIAGNLFFSHEHLPFWGGTEVVPQCASRWPSAKSLKDKQLAQINTAKWPQPFMFQYVCRSPDNPPAFHTRCSYSLVKSDDFRRHLPTLGPILTRNSNLSTLLYRFLSDFG